MFFKCIVCHYKFHLTQLEKAAISQLQITTELDKSDHMQSEKDSGKTCIFDNGVNYAFKSSS